MKEKLVVPEPALITPAALASIFGVPVARVYELSHRGTLGFVRIGRLMRFRPEDVEVFLASGGERAFGEDAE